MSRRQLNTSIAQEFATLRAERLASLTLKCSCHEVPLTLYFQFGTIYYFVNWAVEIYFQNGISLFPNFGSIWVLFYTDALDTAVKPMFEGKVLYEEFAECISETRGQTSLKQRQRGCQAHNSFDRLN